jgi:sulfite reductase beta subunit-like hemoprotein
MAHSQPLFAVPARSNQEVARFADQVARLQSGDHTPTAFRAYRVPMGVYEHRTPGSHMVRTHLAAGFVLSHQLERIAELSTKYGNGILHATTRQNIQIHDVPLESLTPASRRSSRAPAPPPAS